MPLLSDAVDVIKSAAGKPVLDVSSACSLTGFAFSYIFVAKERIE
jgi:hypothetical protein